MIRTLVAVMVIAGAASAEARQSSSLLPPPAPTASLSGPRLGTTFLSLDAIDSVRIRTGQDVGSMITQVGWQFEKRFYSNGPTGITAVTEWVPLVGGLDQGVTIPSLTWLVGVRTAEGLEFAAGPNFTPAGTAFAIAGGVTLRSGRLNFPINVAVVPSKAGVRVSFLAGFNSRR